MNSLAEPTKESWYDAWKGRPHHCTAYALFFANVRADYYYAITKKRDWDERNQAVSGDGASSYSNKPRLARSAERMA